jgi:hypothetical protein
MEQQIHRLVTAATLETSGTEQKQLPWTPIAKMQLTKLILMHAEAFGTEIEAFAK